MGDHERDVSRPLNTVVLASAQNMQGNAHEGIGKHREGMRAMVSPARTRAEGLHRCRGSLATENEGVRANYIRAPERRVRKE